MSQQFIILEKIGAVFAESGVNFDLHNIAPSGLKASMRAQFMSFDANGKPTKIEQVVGTKAQGDSTTVIPLHRYPGDREQAMIALNSMIQSYDDVKSGDRKAKMIFGAALMRMAKFGLHGAGGVDPMKALLGPVADLVEYGLQSECFKFNGDELVAATDYVLGN